jgi:hypothetical protein
MEVSCEANSEPGASKQQNFLGVVFSHPVSIFVEGDFQNPMELIFRYPNNYAWIARSSRRYYPAGDMVCKGKLNFMKWRAKIYAKWRT